MSYRDDVKQLVIATISRNPGRPVSDEAARGLITKVASGLAIVDAEADPSSIDVEQLWREVQTQCSIWIRGGHGHLSRYHRDWLTERLSSTEWYFWGSYDRYLRSESKLPPTVIDDMDSLTNDVLKELGDPQQREDWDRRGMVVGQVQSGKTADYMGLINKALDTGYKIVIVLAGTQDTLRSQTQRRLDTGVIGGETRLLPNGAVGRAIVGVERHRDPAIARRSVIPLTDARLEGDFGVMKFTPMQIGGESALLLVVKKNSRILQRIHLWVQAYAQERGGGQPGVLPNVPLLMIDDEADSAGVNVAPNDEESPTAINRHIREILNDFGQKSYVGYTATPFANIFIVPDDDEADPSRYGPDLFPRDFIFNLPTPSNYVGPEELFGLSDSLHEDTSNPGLPLIHCISDYQDCFPDRHKKDLRVTSLPQSLLEAVKAFIIVCAARRARSKDPRHNSMMVHVSRFIHVQNQVVHLIEEEISRIQRTLEFATGDSYTSLMDDLKKLWEEDLSAKRDTVFEATRDPMLIPITWEAVRQELRETARKIQIKTINGMVREALDYDDYKDVGLWVIAVGGDKLSRGLTLEDISISYYLRASTMYDTLLQMGRWFGYKDGFLDLCRLYTTDDIASYYEWIALANRELRQEFDSMVRSHRSPINYGLRVRQHPTVLQVTSANKMRSAKKMLVSYPGVLLETFCFAKNSETQKNNFELTKSWLSQLPPGDIADGDCITWKDVPGEMLVDFLQGFSVHPRCHKMDPMSVGEYIRKQMELDELKKWTVCMISAQSAESVRFTIGAPYPDMWTPVRIDKGNPDAHEYLLSQQQMINPRDEYRDLDPEELRGALEDTARAWEEDKLHGARPTRPSGKFIREHRKADHGLLLIYPLKAKGPKSTLGWENGIQPTTPVVGLAISFPETASATAVEYVGNQTWYEQRYEEDSND